MGAKTSQAVAVVAVGVLLACAACAHRAGVVHDALDASAPVAVRTLPRVGGGAVDLAEAIANHDATVLVWWATTCPCARRYQSRVAALAQRYPAERVAVFYVSSNADDTPERIEAVAKRRGIGLPILRDENARLADWLGAETTPTVVVVDRSGRVRYRGWFDNERRPGESGRIAYVETVVAHLLGNARGEAPASSPVFGCPITRVAGEKGRCTPPPPAP